jgi:hypothetical protein
VKLVDPTDEMTPIRRKSVLKIDTVIITVYEEVIDKVLLQIVRFIASTGAPSSPPTIGSLPGGRIEWPMLVTARRLAPSVTAC